MANLSISNEGQLFLIKASGDWSVRELTEASLYFRQYRILTNKEIVFDAKDIENIDTAGMLLIITSLEKLERQGCKTRIEGFSSKQQQFYELVQKYRPKESLQHSNRRFLLMRLYRSVGENVVEAVRSLFFFLYFFGENIVAVFYTIFHPSTLRTDTLFKQLELSALRALPIIAVTSFLIGIVVAFQAAVQLEKFGANIFIVEMLGISLFRELSPLIGAIVIAGRSASAFTAQIGVMRITEEVDAMKTMGFDPHRFLVLPRMLALVIAMPLIVFFADIVALGGGMIVAYVQLDISYTEFINRLEHSVAVKHFVIGIVKAPFFGWIIAAVGCFRGFQIAYNTESVGKYTTMSVVNAIFFVIAFDALFSIMLTQWGI